MKIDNDFKNLLPELTREEYTGLERDIVKHGILSPIIVWNGTIVDGHNRYAIAQAHRFPESAIPIKEINFDSKASAMQWIVDNQFAKRNLEFSQKIILQSKVHDELKKEASANTGTRTDLGVNLPHGSGGRVSEQMASKLGISEKTYRDAKYVVDHGTPDQIARMDKGGKGNGVSTIAKEIKGTKIKETFKCRECGKLFPISEAHKRGNGKTDNICKLCHNKNNKKSHDRMSNQYEKEFQAQHNERTFEYLQMELKSIVEASVHNIMDTIKDYESREILIDEESANSIHEILSALSKIVESVKEKKND